MVVQCETVVQDVFFRAADPCIAKVEVDAGLVTDGFGNDPGEIIVGLAAAHFLLVVCSWELYGGGQRVAGAEWAGLDGLPFGSE